MRLPLIPPSELDATQRPLYDDMRAGIEKGFRGFAAIAADGALMRPWSPWPLWGLTKALSAKQTLPRSAREVAILVTGARFRAAYEVYAHVIAAERRGLTDDKLATIAAGQRRADLTRDEAVAHDVASALVNGRVLPELCYRRAVEAFGRRGAAGGAAVLPRRPLLPGVRDAERLRRAGAGPRRRGLGVMSAAGSEQPRSGDQPARKDPRTPDAAMRGVCVSGGGSACRTLVIRKMGARGA